MAGGGERVRRLFAIASLNLMQVVRSRSELLSYIVLPLTLTWVFGLAFGGSSSSARAVRVPVADKDQSHYSAMVVKTIDGSESFTASMTSEAEARREVRDGEAPVAVIIPRGFGHLVEQGATATVVAVRDPASSEAQAAVEVVNGAAARIAADAVAAQATFAALQAGAGGVYPSDAPDFRELFSEADRFWQPKPPVAVTVSEVRASATHHAELSAPAGSQYSMGFTVFFVLMICIAGAGGIIEEREFGTLRRLLATPTGRTRIIGGKLLGVAMIGALEATVLVGFGVLIFKVPWGSSPAAVIMVLGSLILASTGLGVMLSASVRTRSQLAAMSSVLSTALAMIGGCYWPLEITPPFMQKLALATPTGWAMIGLKNTVARGMGVASVLLPCAVLLTMAAVFFVVGLSRLRLE